MKMKNVNDGIPSTYGEASVLCGRIERAGRLYDAVRKAHEAYGGTKTLQEVLASFERLGGWSRDEVSTVALWLAEQTNPIEMFIRGRSILVTLTQLSEGVYAATAQHDGVKVGDIVYDPSTNQRYCVRVIDYYLDPPDMFLAELRLL